MRKYDMYILENLQKEHVNDNCITHLVTAYLENLCNMYLCLDFVWTQCKTMYL